LVLALLAAGAIAGTLRLRVDVGPEGATIAGIERVDRHDSRVPPRDGPIEILGPGDSVLRSVGFEDPRLRSIIDPVEGGLAVRLDHGLARVDVPWPEGATGVRLGGRVWRPPAPPPSTAEGVVGVQIAGDPAERLDLVFLGDGYTEAELPTFAADVQRVVDYLGSIEPYGAYTSLLNVWRVEVPSVDDGVTHDETGVVKNTAFGCYYGCGGTDRLVCCDENAVLDAASRIGDYDGVMVLINDPTYGGSGGFTYAAAYTGYPDGVQVAAHELGHSLFYLRDEYSYGIASPLAFTGPNCTTMPDAPQWSEWLGVDGVDAYEECSYTDFWRPTENGCMMRTLRDQYCPVCRQAAVLAMYARLPDLVPSVDPPEDSFVDARGGLDPVIHVDTVVPASQLEFTWYVAGEPIAGASGPDFHPRCRGLVGTVSVTVRDATPWVREDPQDLLSSDHGPWAVLSDRCGEPARGCGCSNAGPGSFTPAGLLVLAAWAAWCQTMRVAIYKPGSRPTSCNSSCERGYPPPNGRTPKGKAQFSLSDTMGDPMGHP
jgi:hypothetical protein